MKRLFLAILSMIPGTVAAQSFGYAGTPASCFTNCPINAVLPYYTPGATISFTGGANAFSFVPSLSGGGSSGVIISNIDQNNPGSIFAATVIAYQYQMALMNAPQIYPGNPSSTIAVGQPPASVLSAPVTLQVTQGSSTPAVPEPASWAMMILGIGVMGLALRRQAADRGAPATSA